MKEIIERALAFSLFNKQNIVFYCLTNKTIINDKSGHFFPLSIFNIFILIKLTPWKFYTDRINPLTVL